MAESRVPRGLYALTDTDLLPDERIVDAVEQALAGGAAMIQYRDKRPDRDLKTRIATELRECCHRYGRPLLINDDPELALRMGADGVHLGLEDHDPHEARAMLGEDAIIGVTCHQSLERARALAGNPADYVAFGRFFPSQTKAGPALADPSLLSECHRLGIPCVAIGGITLDNAGPLIRAGADLIAVIHGLFSAPDIEARARALSQLFATGADS
ncbi:thiamine-phosphate diphosphorylase [Halospina denitrificans]|uniref:Thiamine-phosphate synthase n=1 Tax=Halospina denitrificans TaxID=332522 RepID=A0A4R7K175_9GAMM|nr:thiamine phosphate synthase [Halospina denitrificans]TDT44610.1 thiamine-phosphate diphosphorylase [Halospina denitrificans]